MDLKIALLFAGASGLLGIAFGYFLRFIISLGKRGSMELEIKQMTLTAKEEAQKIIEEADKKAAKINREAEEAEKEKVVQSKKPRSGLLKKRSC